MCPKCGADACQCPAAESRPPALAEQSRAMPTDSSGPDGIIVGEYSGVMQAAFLRRGIRMITVDYGPSRVPGAWHYQGDARDIVFTRRWKLLIGHPDCTHIARCGSDRWKLKITDHRHWWGLADVLLWLSAPADAVMVEQPIGALERYFPLPFQNLQPWMFGHCNSKCWRLYCSDNVPTIFPTDIVPGRVRFARGGSARARSTTQVGMAEAVAAQVDPRKLAPRRQPPLVYAYAIKQLAATYVLANGADALPPDHDHPMAMPQSRPPRMR